MISYFRKLFTSRIGTVLALLFVVLIGFAFALSDVSGTGGFGGVGGVGGGNAARVGDATISTADLASAVDAAHQRARGDNPNLDRANFVRQGGMDGALERLVASVALGEFGRMAGIGVSKAMIDGEIRALGIGRGPDGNFSDRAFRATLANNGISEEALRADLTRTLFAEQLLTPVTAGNFAPRSLVLPYAGLALERREGEVALIPSAAFVPAGPPTDAVLAQYLQRRGARFTVPEQRVIAYARFGADIVGARSQPTDAEIAKYYADNQARYAASETRDIAHVVAPTEAAAKALADRVRGGTAIAAAASGVGLAVVNSAGQARAAYAGVAGDAVAAAAFAAPRGGVVGPVRGSLGWYVLSIGAVNQVAARPLAAVRAEIAATLIEEKAATILSDMTAAMEDALVDGTSLTEVARANGLSVARTPLVVGSGRNAKDPAYQPTPEVARIIATGFQIEEGGEAQLVEVAPGSQYALVGVERVVPAAPPPLAEIKPLVLRAWALEQGNGRAKTAAEAVRRAVAGGQSLAAALAAVRVNAGATLPPPRTVAGTRGELAGQGRDTPPPVALMFALPQGAVRSLEAAGDQGFFVVHLTRTVEGNAAAQPALVEAARGEFARLLPDEYARQFANAAKVRVGVERNDTAIAQVRAQFAPATTGQ